MQMSYKHILIIPFTIYLNKNVDITFSVDDTLCTNLHQVRSKIESLES